MVVLVALVHGTTGIWSMVWYGIVWYGMVWYGMVPACENPTTTAASPECRNRVLATAMSLWAGFYKPS